ncbi:MAG: hypothetical protein PF444_05750 [Bacteroidales bacterium]|jgi:hypothetical protein|nr:hypothetical protein [Bacteroidales bacterium]
MKNKQSLKYLLSGIVLMSAIALNVNHYQKTKLSLSTKLSDVIIISTCQAEKLDIDDPILSSPGNPNDNMTEEEYLELLRKQRQLILP